MIIFHYTGKKIAATWKQWAILSIVVLLVSCCGSSTRSAVSTSTVTSPATVDAFDQNEKQSSSCLTMLPADSALTPDPAIVCGRLDNGFRYLLMENKHPQDRVSVHLYVRAGSLNETDAQQGLAHFLEHMLFNGSTHFPPGELIRYFQSIGMQFGNDANAHTGFDETVYDIVLPTGDEENLQKGLLVMQDYAMGALLLEEEVKRESGVILAEMRARDSAAYRTFKASMQFEYPDFLLSRRLPIGKADIIRNADRTLLKDFYDTWYRPDNMVLVMVGDFKIPVAQTLIESQFKALTPRAPEAKPPNLGTINHKGLKVFYHHEPEIGGTTVSIEVVRAYQQQADDLSQRRQEVIAEMADRIVQNRLDTLQKRPEAPYTDAAVGSGTYLNHIRYAEITADCSAQHWQRTATVLEMELRRARRFGFTEAELARVKKELLNMLDRSVKEAPTRNSTQLARSMIRQLSKGRVIQSPSQVKALLKPIVESATAADLHQAFLDNWPDDHRLVLVTGDVDLKKNASKPPTSQIRDAFLRASAAPVHPPKSKPIATFPYLPTPDKTGTIASVETIKDLGITRVRFGNGIRLNLKPTDFKTNEVLANLIFGSGQSQEPVDHPGISLLAEATINESGLGALNSNELERALAGTSTSVEFSIMEAYFNYSAKSVSGEMELLFQLLYAHLKDPGFRDDAMQLVRERLRQNYQSLSRSIDGMMRIKGLRLLAGGDTRFGIPSAQDLEAIDLNDIRNWITPALASAPLELSMVGDFDQDQVIELACLYLGSLPDHSGQLSQRSRTDLPQVPVGSSYHIEVDTKITNAMVVVAWPTEDFWDIRRTRRLSVLADIFSERLRERIREKLGASYSPYAFNQGSRAYKGYGTLQTHVNVSPSQINTVLAEVEAIASDLAQKGVNEDERLRAIDPILTSIKEYRQTNEYWLNSVMTGSDRAAEQFEWARSFVGDYGTINSQELSELATTYLSGGRAIIIIEPKKDK